MENSLGLSRAREIELVQMDGRVEGEGLANEEAFLGAHKGYKVVEGSNFPCPEETWHIEVTKKKRRIT